MAYDPRCWDFAAQVVNSLPEVAATVVYANVAQHNSIAPSKVSSIYHLAGKGSNRPIRSENLTVYTYPDVQSYTFAIPFQNAFHYGQEALSHTRSLMHLKKQMDGPWFDLELIWEEHTFYEFADRSVEHTMSTMVQEPYVNHVPTVWEFLNPS